MRQMGWAWSSSPHRHWGKEEVAWHRKLAWARDGGPQRVPINRGPRKLPHLLMPDACSSCAACPMASDPIWEAASQALEFLNLCLVCSGARKRFTGTKHLRVLFYLCSRDWVGMGVGVSLSMGS